MSWLVWLSAGSGPRPAKGPYRDASGANNALRRFRERYGAEAGTYEAACSLRLVEFPSRELARNADISDYAEHGGQSVPAEEKTL